MPVEMEPELPLIQLYPGTSSEFVRSTLDATAGYAAGIGPACGTWTDP